MPDIEWTLPQCRNTWKKQIEDDGHQSHSRERQNCRESTSAVVVGKITLQMYN
jgi:hypothetical protein